MDIQGMIVVQPDDASKAMYITWGCVSPSNNIWQYGEKRFSGVGGHLFAIASELSMKRGYDGFVCGEATDQKLYNYYIAEFGAVPLPPLHNPYRFMISGRMTEKIREVYNYEWTDESI